MSAEAVKAAVEAAMLAENMSLAEASGDKSVWLGEAGWRDRYYANKLGPGQDTPAARQAMADEYVRGLCWVGLYYTQGVPSWTWFYPFHYAPFACDLAHCHTRPPA